MDNLDLDPVEIAKHKPYLVDDPVWSAIAKVLEMKPDKESAWNEDQLMDLWKSLGGTEQNIATGYDRNVAIERLSNLLPAIPNNQISAVSAMNISFLLFLKRYLIE